MESYNNKLRCICPILKSPKSYNPDTIDLLNNVNERTYWLATLDEMVHKFVKRAANLNPDCPQATEKAQNCYEKFHKLIQQCTDNPTILKPLSVRTLLDYNEDNLRANNFKDAWRLQKEKESARALFEFENRIREIDEVQELDEKWLELIRGVLAGNVFDWGSRAVSDILERSQNFGLNEAMSTIQVRPWFMDDLDAFIAKIKLVPYKNVVIFVDNAGVDFILGILPVVRELLQQNSRVILTANSSPALNDVTFNELNLYCCKAAQFCDVLKQAISNGKLLTVENGQKGPCLDLNNLSEELCGLMNDVDLVVIEGMGRAVHTNLHAEFLVDSLKIAVLKNEWLAKSLGAQQFSVICKFQSVI